MVFWHFTQRLPCVLPTTMGHLNIYHMSPNLGRILLERPQRK